MAAIPVLIPAYNPDQRLLRLVVELKAAGLDRIVVVDDGSRADCQPVFARLQAEPGCTVLRHAVNLGKGRALKTGLNQCYLLDADAAGVVTADADGQHLAADIAAIAAALCENRNRLVLGSRRFDGVVPWRSRFGNAMTRWVFRFLAGTRVHDTQSGLRGIPRAFIPTLLQTAGERYEFEMNMLLVSRRSLAGIVQVPIATVYVENNRGSHFNPFLDSMRIYFLLLRFLFSSLLASLIDFVVFVLAYRLLGSILASIVLARAVSSLSNFMINRKFVFHVRRHAVRAAIKYYSMIALFAGCSYILIWNGSHVLGLPVVAAKALAETLLFLASFSIQRDFVFKMENGNEESEPVHP
jgi:putative flippase GtrA